MQVKRYRWHEIAEMYPGIVAKFFPRERLNPNEAPAMVYVARDAAGNISGFVAGYFHNLETFYIQRIGLETRRQWGAFFAEVAREMEEGGTRFLTGAIENTNRAALIIALKAGFMPNGIRMDTTRKMFVELILNIRSSARHIGRLNRLYRGTIEKKTEENSCQ